MGNQQSNAGAAQFFAGVTDVITKPINAVVGKPIIPSASAAVAASSDPNVNPNAGANRVEGLVTATAITGPGMFGKLMPQKPPNMNCAQAVGRDKPTLNSDTNVWYCGTGNDGDRAVRQKTQRYGANGGVIGNNPTPGPTNEWTGGGTEHQPPPGTGYTPNRGPQQQWSSRPGDGVTPPGSGPVNMPYGQAPMSNDPVRLNPQFNLSGSMDPGNKTVLGGDANSLSVHQGFPNLNASPANNSPAPPAAVPALDTNTLVMIGGVVVVGALLLAKKKV
jgi:hypothetical protein